jgi:hypothetical protein
MSRVSGWHDCVAFSALLGKVLAKIEGGVGDDDMVFETTEGARFALYHAQDCCESVSIAEIIGDLSDLVGEPLLEAEEVSSDDAPAPEHSESYTWTFYKLGTRKGSVTLRWLGESNGCYSEGVSFTLLSGAKCT